ncbi:MAG: hypothetical protein ACFFDN_37170, partial [Candidatus Hodarchaeota archaeon]
ELIPAFNSLSKIIASKRIQKNKEIEVKIGSTGAAKILFVIRPKALIPWDKKIRKKFNFKESGESYVEFLSQIKSILENLEIECKNFGFSLDDLPKKIGRPNSTVPKLIDEYYWVMITNPNSKLDPEIFRRWIQWSGIKF